MQGDMQVAFCFLLPLYQLDNGIFPSIRQPNPLIVVRKIIHAMHPDQKLSYSYHWFPFLFVPIQFSEASKQKSQKQAGLASSLLKPPLAALPGKFFLDA